MSSFALKQNVEVLSHVTREHLEAFWLVSWGGGQNVTVVQITTQKIVKSLCNFLLSGRIEKIIEKTPPVNTPYQISAS
jgi:hypothetical protein